MNEIRIIGPSVPPPPVAGNPFTVGNVSGLVALGLTLDCGFTALGTRALAVAQNAGSPESVQFHWHLCAITASLPLFFLAGLFGQGLGFAAVAAMVYWLFLAVTIFSAEQIFTAALYLYANESRVPPGFARVDLKSAWEGLPPLPAGQAL